MGRGSYNLSMRPGALRPVLAIACVAGGVACLDASGNAPFGPDASAARDGPRTSAVSVRFEPPGTIVLGPGDSRDLAVVVDPAGTHIVRFALQGDSLDASLDADLRETDDSGRTHVVLVAPQSATTFRVRATADDGPSAEAAVSVSGEGFGSVMVVPSYSGRRETPVWTATAAARTTCAQLKGIPPPDGPIVVQASAGEPLVLDSLPVGPDLAITVRSAHAVGGCSDVGHLGTSENHTETVKAIDRPINLGAADLNALALFGPDGTILGPIADHALTDLLDAFAHHDEERTALLDTMQASSSNAAQFSSARSVGAWDIVTAAHLTSKGLPLRDRIRTWASYGSLPLYTGAAFSGRVLQGQAGPSHAVLRLGGLFGLDAVQLGCPVENIVAWSADTGDVVHIGGSLYFLPTQYAAAAADDGAMKKIGVNATRALIDAVSCTDLGNKLAIASAIPTCPNSCLASLCVSSIEQMWTRARDTSARSFDAGNLAFTIAADATVDGEAAMVSFSGTWAGSCTTRSDNIAAKGRATGTTP